MTTSQEQTTASQQSKPTSKMDTADYWTKFISTSLSKVVRDTDSDCEETGNQLINEEILNAPRRKSAREELARKVAGRLYPSADPESLAPIIKYEKEIVMLRNMVLEQRRRQVADATARNAKFDWVKRISKQGAWNAEEDPLSLKGAPSLPMPVDVSDKDSLAPFFAHLRNNGTNESPSTSSTTGESTIGVEPFYGVELIEFEKGVLYSDGRIDLCKMVTGPRNIGDLMDSLEPNTFSKHFLLGNNIIGPVGAKAIADFIERFPERFETWYLAGNCIDTASFSILVDSMVKSDVITNVWLKRNPLGENAAEDVFRLIANTKNLRTLDLDQTELGDAGIAKLFSLLASHDAPLPLRHIYLNATGVGEDACKQIAKYLQSTSCSLHSLYISNNPIGDAGATALAQGLKTNTSLKRLSMQSCGLTNITTLLSASTNLETLNLGQSYATEDLGMRYNWLTDANAASIITLINTAPQLKYLDLAYTPTTQPQLNQILTAVLDSNLVWFHAKSLVTGGKDVASVKAGQEHSRLDGLVRKHLHANVEKEYGVDYVKFENTYKRFLVSPTDVRLIDSVYRNRDAGAARRGLKTLQKWWKGGDVTLQQVQEGTFA
ncbi:hypothetical protein LTR17_010933 [Elasticomyces elasticus]|nr:hypothetical protein LTR17_010933 [Elasticomyces elasticus]